jgi:hypothetical protein
MRARLPDMHQISRNQFARFRAQPTDLCLASLKRMGFTIMGPLTRRSRFRQTLPAKILTLHILDRNRTLTPRSKTTYLRLASIHLDPDRHQREEVQAVACTSLCQEL